MAVIMMAAVLYVVGAADPLDQHPVTAAPTTCATPVALRNGDFESPLIAAGSVAAVPLPGWQPAPVLLRRDGGQHAELTTGTIHQDVTTTPGQTLRWELRHRGGTLTVLAGPADGPLDQQGDTITGDRAAWATYAGAYTVPEGQTTTRFALRATGPTAVDAVSFGTPACLLTTTTVATAKAKVNDRLTYAVTTRNAGGNPARATTVTAEPGPRSKPVGLLRPGESHTFRYEVPVAPTMAGTTLRTRATTAYSTSLTGAATESSTSNTVGTTIAPAADLAVAATTATGDVTTYRITTTNKGPSPADATQVTATLPDGTTGVAAASPTGTCSLTSTTAECAYSTLRPGESRTMTVTAVPATATPATATPATATPATATPATATPAVATPAGVIPASGVTVTASSATGELTPQDNVIGFQPEAPATPPADHPAALAVTASAPSVPRDGTASFEATVRNDTPTATSATVRVHPAPGLAITDGIPDLGTYTDGTWTVPGLPPHTTAHLNLTATALATGDLTLTVSTGDTKKKATITATPASTSLAITVDRPRSPAAFDVSDTIPLRYRLTNDGTEPLDRILVTDTLTGPATCPKAFLTPNATMLCEAPPYTVTQDDVDAALPLTTIVTAEAHAPTSTNPLLFGTKADLPLVTARPSLTVTAAPTTYLLRNNGNQTLSNVRVSSTETGRATCTTTTLPPGATTTCTLTAQPLSPSAPTSAPTSVYAYGTTPGATTATAFGPFPTHPAHGDPDSSTSNGTQGETQSSTGSEAQGPSTGNEAHGPSTGSSTQGETPPSTGNEAQGPSTGSSTQGETQPSTGSEAQGGPPTSAEAPGQDGPPTSGEAQGQGAAQGQSAPQGQSAAQGQARLSSEKARAQAPGQAASPATAGQSTAQQAPTAPALPATVPSRGAAPQLSAPATPNPSVPNPTPTVITPPPAVVPTREQRYWADPIPDPVPFSGSPLATASVLGLALLAGGLIVLASLRGRWWPCKAGRS
ncbi:hypothetical protein [Actinoplanes sp. NPDC048796]|uniref:DUF7507 domain-containing protein n=1 Tax=Actinoplanes sp. NPDC048796 TaxID=3155640 RepID=UPI0033D26BBD